MREEVVVHNGNAHYYPNFQNPIYLAAEKEKLKQEILFRIRNGNFENLYLLIRNINLTTSDIDAIISFWRENHEELLYIYYNALMWGDLNQIKLADSLYNVYKLQVESETSRRK